MMQQKCSPFLYIAIAFVFLFSSGSIHAQSAELNAARNLFDAGNFVAALAQTDALLAKDEDNADAWTLSGRVRLAMKDVKGAETDLQKAIQLDDSNGEAKLYLGVVLYLTGKYKESIQQLDKAEKLLPNDYKVYFNRALSWEELPNLNKSISDLDKALSIKPDFINGYLKRSEMYFELENFKESIADCNRAIGIDSTNAEAYFRRGIALGGEAKDKEAVADFNKAIELKPNHDEALTYRGAAKLLSGNKKGACLDWKRAMELGNDMAEENYTKYCESN
ncbi:MAG: tetratricopeptide repeat protein [Bacteroidia bacterium]|nr:tetratricopeptide repeat protein [Bacteroidia bacterium]